ncbi:MAG TPA: hypothetical protein VHE61_11140 [Opitutaceae bacterium]|nr:hypothetical protein [Opitutaceae bacterium]
MTCPRTHPPLRPCRAGGTDGERRWVGSLSLYQVWARDNASREWRVAPQLKYRPVPALTVSLAAGREHLENRRQFVPGTDAAGKPAYLVSTLNSDTLTFTARAQWFIRPELSVQYYGSPFGSTGTYARFERVVSPRAAEYDARGHALGPPSIAGARYGFDENGDGAADLFASRPDFSFGQFRSNLVLRWEFRPGSNLYVVWAQERSDWRGAPVNAGAALGRLTSAPATNVLLVKCSYWFAR